MRLSTYNYITILLLLIISLMILSPACTSDNQNPKNLDYKQDENETVNNRLIVNEAEDDESYSSSIIPLDNYLYSPLTVDKFTAIVNGTDYLAAIGITYTNRSDGMTRLLINAGRILQSQTIDEFTSYDCALYQHVLSPSEYRYYEHDFLALEVEAIFDYLSSNSNYFFNNEEYDGIYPPPIVSPSGPRPICDGNYEFSFEIIEPGMIKETWAIHKCVDEYPAPDHPLYGLFQMLENDFIDQFTEADRVYY